MRIAVTGARGRLGRAVVARLSEQEGVETVGIDKGTAPRDDDAPTRDADLCDLGQVYGALAGVDAVIHLGAIPAPTGLPPERVFGNNIVSQFNVFEAAATLGIRRVVSASSVSALGFPWQYRWSEPLYLPIDEEHPLLPQDCYGLSKAAGEEIAAAYCRRGAGSAASLRFSTILSDEDTYRRVLASTSADPQRAAALLWSYVDRRDAAEACVLAVTASFEGHQPLYITAADTTAERPTDELIAQWYPTVPRRPGERRAHWSLLDCTRATDTIGYQPRYTWLDVVGKQ